MGAPLVLALLAQACGGHPCPFDCPATYLTVEVSSAADGGGVSSAQATLSGPTTVMMSCEPNGGAVLCSWSSSVTPGNYTLNVTAPGFTTANVNATVTVPPADSCGCVFGSIEPSKVTLDPS